MSVTNASPFKRLPTNIKPINYNLKFTPNTRTLKFNAEAVITLEVLERTNSIFLNSKDLHISEASYENACANIKLEPLQELAIFSFSDALSLGRGQLTLKFAGNLSNNMEGFYHSKYKSSTGEESVILCTQFESVYARRAFPCMDEPDRKATFDITLVVTDNQVALSNMPEYSRTPVQPPTGLDLPPTHHNYVEIQFNTSKIMSTYLVAMVVGQFEYISEMDSNGVEIRVYTPPGKQQCGEYALEVAVKSLPFYDRLFGHKFPLPKLDLIAIPDFACGAMENWGLITYRETALLIEKQQSTLLSKQQVALTVAHELAHMWFGNLVTMKWWTHLWLNEGFATWIEYLAVDYCFPDYDIWTLFVSREYSRALKLDELRSSHPIEVEVNSPNEVEEIFDAVSYQKGSCVIRMLNEYLGSDVFRAGLQLYINTHKYSNTVTEDLWEALEKVSEKPVGKIMSTWTKKMGFPVLSVRMLSVAEGSPISLAVTQDRFVTDGVKDESSEWYIPVTICKADDSASILSHCLLETSSTPHENSLTTANKKREQVIILPHKIGSIESPTVRLNPGATGFYRVLYDKSMLHDIQLALEKGVIPESDRLSLIDDQFALARAGYSDLTTALQLASSFKMEMQYSVWSVLVDALNRIRILVEEANYQAGDDIDFAQLSLAEIGLNKVYTQMATAVYNKLGWDAKVGESNNDTLLRPLIISIMGRSGNKEVFAEASKRFEVHYRSIVETPSGQEVKNLIAPDLRTTVYSMCMRNGGSEYFDKLITLHDKATMHDERVRVLACLGCSPNAQLIERLFNLTLTDFVRKQDRYHCLLSVTGSPGGRRALWKFVQSNFNNLGEQLATTALLSHVLKGSCCHFATPGHYEKVKLFFDKNPVPCCRAIQQSLEAISVNSKLLDSEGANLDAFLTKF